MLRHLPSQDQTIMTSLFVTNVYTNLRICPEGLIRMAETLLDICGEGFDWMRELLGKILYNDAGEISSPLLVMLHLLNLGLSEYQRARMVLQPLFDEESDITRTSSLGVYSHCLVALEENYELVDLVRKRGRMLDESDWEVVTLMGKS
jgi:hypothetical protein